MILSDATARQGDTGGGGGLWGDAPRTLTLADGMVLPLKDWQFARGDALAVTGMPPSVPWLGGSGRTTIRVETPRLVQIETQGIADQSPFAFSAEARRIGTCTAPSPGLAAREKARPRLGIR